MPKWKYQEPLVPGLPGDDSYYLATQEHGWVLFSRGNGDWDLDGPFFEMYGLGYEKLTLEEAQASAEVAIKSALKSALSILDGER